MDRPLLTLCLCGGGCTSRSLPWSRACTRVRQFVLVLLQPFGLRVRTSSCPGLGGVSNLSVSEPRRMLTWRQTGRERRRRPSRLAGVSDRVRLASCRNPASSARVASGGAREPPVLLEAVGDLPECQQPPVKACSKEAPERPPMRGGRCVWRPHLFFLGSRLDARWQEVWPRHENESRVWLESQPPEFFFSRSDEAAAADFLRCREQWLQR